MSERTQEQDGAMPAMIPAHLAEVLAGEDWTVSEDSAGPMRVAQCHVAPLTLTWWADEPMHVSIGSSFLTVESLKAAYEMYMRVEAALAAAPDQEGR